MTMGTRGGAQKELFITHQQLRSQCRPCNQAVEQSRDLGTQSRWRRTAIMTADPVTDLRVEVAAHAGAIAVVDAGIGSPMAMVGDAAPLSELAGRTEAARAAVSIGATVTAGEASVGQIAGGGAAALARNSGGAVGVAHALVVGARESRQWADVETTAVPAIAAVRVPATRLAWAGAGRPVSTRAGAGQRAGAARTRTGVSSHAVPLRNTHEDVRRVACVTRLAVVQGGAKAATCDGQYPCAWRQGDHEPEKGRRSNLHGPILPLYLERPSFLPPRPVFPRKSSQGMMRCARPGHTGARIRC